MQLINTYQHYFRIQKLLRFAIFKTQHRIEHNSLLYVLKSKKITNQNPKIEEEQTTQWPKEKDKRTNNDLQNT
jgi:hypothetical protein